MNTYNCSLLTILYVAALAIGAPMAPADGQSKEQGQKSPQGQAPPMPYWKVSVSADEPARVTLLAEDAPLAKVSSEIAAKLGVPVVLSRLMRARRITAEFADAPLEAALRALAPQPFVDHALSSDAWAERKIIGVYLHALNEEPPPPNASVKARGEAMMLEGDTEEPANSPGDSSREPPLRVSMDGDRLSVQARKQPITAVLYEMASKLGVPFEMRRESSEVVDLDLAGYTAAEVLRLLPPGVRLYQRTDLLSGESKPLRIILVKPKGDSL